MIFFFFFNDTATTEIYTLSLHDALPISRQAAAVHGLGVRPGRRVGREPVAGLVAPRRPRPPRRPAAGDRPQRPRSEEHTSELQSRQYLVCRLLLEKKKKKQTK